MGVDLNKTDKNAATLPSENNRESCCVIFPSPKALAI